MRADLGLHEWWQRYFPVANPGQTWQGSWATEVLAHHLEKVATGEITRLVVTMPPMSGKSQMVDVAFPVWLSTKQTGARFLSVSTDTTLVKRDVQRSLTIYRSPEFTRVYGEYVPEQLAEMDFANVHGGTRFSSSPEGRIIGRHFDFAVLDDLLKVQTLTEAKLTAAQNFFENVLPSRLAPDARVVVIMQRLHEADPAQLAIDAGYEHLNLPLLAEQTRDILDLREPEEVLDDRRWSPARVRELQAKPRMFATQYQQRPAPAGGDLIKESWLKYWDKATLPPQFSSTVASWDLALGGKQTSDYTVGMVVAKAGANYYVLALSRGQRTFGQARDAIRTMAHEWNIRRNLIEGKASGDPMIDELSKEVSGCIRITPTQDKVYRVNEVSDLFEAGNVFLPSPKEVPWVKGLVHELVTFPQAKHDDQVDALTQALSYLRANRGTEVFVDAMSKITQPGFPNIFGSGQNVPWRGPGVGSQSF